MLPASSARVFANSALRYVCRASSIACRIATWSMADLPKDVAKPAHIEDTANVRRNIDQPERSVIHGELLPDADEHTDGGRVDEGQASAVDRHGAFGARNVILDRVAQLRSVADVDLTGE